jgi:AcrR family transcriptional regulator
MARPKSEDKRNAILNAATRVFAERGLAHAPTSAISKAAGVAEGSLFSYFRTKDVLINELYCEIKRQMAEIMLAGFPDKGDVRARLEHLWNTYVDWGLANPAQRKVIGQLQTSTLVTEVSRLESERRFAAIHELAHDATTEHIALSYPKPFVAAALNALANTTIEFVEVDPAHAADYRRAGFLMFWNGLSKD